VGAIGKIFGTLSEEQINRVIREQARAEIESFFNPTFLAAMRTGFAEFHGFLDTILTYEERLKFVELEIKELRSQKP
jgi:hypothetical protein